MQSKSIVFMVEGPYDSMFIQEIVTPILRKKGFYSYIIYETSHKKFSEIRSYYKNPNFKIIFIADKDEFKCIRQKKEKLKERFYFLEDEAINIVEKEIEGWYIAGIPEKEFKKLGLSINPSRSSNILKEQFEEAYNHKKWKSRVVLMRKILSLFNIEEAKKRNKSFRRFYEKCISSIESNDH